MNRYYDRPDKETKHYVYGVNPWLVVVTGAAIFLVFLIITMTMILLP